MEASALVEAVAVVYVPMLMSPELHSELPVPTMTVLVSVAWRSDMTPAPLISPPLSIFTVSEVLRSCDATTTMLPASPSEEIVVASPSVTDDVPVSVEWVSEAEPLIAPPAPPRELKSSWAWR